MDIPPLNTKQSKSYKLIKIKRKLDEIEAKNLIEEDWILEKEGNALNFLKSNNFDSKPLNSEPKKDFYYKNLELPSLSPKNPEIRSKTRKMTLVSQNKNLPATSNIDYELKFEELLTKIEKAKKDAENEEKQKINLLSPREKIAINRQSHILTNYKKAEKYWKSIQTNLAGKSQKKISQLLSTQGLDGKKNYESSEKRLKSSKNLQDNLLWYMSLRETQTSGQFETYLRVGHELNGLYTRIKGKPVDDYDIDLVNPKNSEELQVIGVSKLPLEIEAVKKVGFEHLKPELLNKENYDEVISEQYDQKLKSINI